MNTVETKRMNLLQAINSALLIACSRFIRLVSTVFMLALPMSQRVFRILVGVLGNMCL